MSKQYDVKKEWEKTKKQLVQFGKEASELIKKGEKEFIQIKKQSQFQLDLTAAGLTKEKLYYQIGKEYVRSPDNNTALLKKLLDEYKAVEQKQKELLAKNEAGSLMSRQKKSKNED
ncbi:MAG: hypothetical protein KBD53_04550 [Candidatus Omnitrophica bacterium]|nr:hypothetical protein [Candidatus Omnitrophota bacterium]